MSAAHRRYGRAFAASLAVPASSLYVLAFKSDCQLDKSCGVKFETAQQFSNWSSTHSCAPRRVYEPQTAQEVSRLLKYAHEHDIKMRPVGSALSPNGIGFSSHASLKDPNRNNDNMNESEAMISMANLDYVTVDNTRRLVTVGAGAKVSAVLSQLKKHNLTLQNFSSIQEQQMAGWTQVAAHGTGITLPSVDDMIVRMKLAVPSGGILTLSRDMQPDLFHLCKVGLGALGVVTELTLACIPQLTLEEQTICLKKADIGKTHVERLKSYRHVRYMWLPYTETVVVVQSNPIALNQSVNSSNNSVKNNKNDIAPPTSALIELLLKKDPSFPIEKARLLTCMQLREILLDNGPLDLAWLKQVNAAEEFYWRGESNTSRIADSTEILGFDCGGEQHVFEVCFPIGKVDDGSLDALKDIKFVESLLELLEKNGIAAPCPIEQRWTCGSSSKMSPSYSSSDDKSKEIFSWVGVIMYLPPNQTAEQRRKITDAFKEYCRLMQPLLEQYNAAVHWAKIEYNGSQGDNEWMRRRIREKFPVEDFRRVQKGNDPNGVLTNDMIDYFLLK